MISVSRSTQQRGWNGDRGSSGRSADGVEAHVPQAPTGEKSDKIADLHEARDVRFNLFQHFAGSRAPAQVVRDMSAYYRSGQAARLWGISAHLVRRLCDAGLVDAERTAGNQWKISHSEVERIKKEGVPEIPSSIDLGGSQFEAEYRPPDTDVPAPPGRREEISAEAAHFAENGRNGLEIGTHPQQLRHWPPPASGHAKSWAVLPEPAPVQAEQERIDWHDSWMSSALRLLPLDAPPETRLVVRETVADALGGLGPQHSPQVIEPLVTAAVAKALQPWNQKRETTRAIEMACGFLPWGAKNSFSPTVWQARVQEMAASAIRRLPADSTFAEKFHIASAAVQQVTSDFEYEELRKRILRAASLWDVAPEEREQAQAAIRTKLDSFPTGTSASALENAREQALVPFRESKKRIERIALALAHIPTYIEELRQAGETDFESHWAGWNFARSLEGRIRPVLERELLECELTDDDLSELVEELVDEELD